MCRFNPLITVISFSNKLLGNVWTLNLNFEPDVKYF